MLTSGWSPPVLLPGLLAVLASVSGDDGFCWRERVIILIVAIPPWVTACTGICFRRWWFLLMWRYIIIILWSKCRDSKKEKKKKEASKWLPRHYFVACLSIMLFAVKSWNAVGLICLLFAVSGFKIWSIGMAGTSPSLCSQYLSVVLVGIPHYCFIKSLLCGHQV